MSNYSEDEQRVLSKEMSDKIYNDSYSTTEEELQKDTNWIEATKGVYKQLEGTEWSGSDEDAAKKGLEMMGRFNYNLTLGTINYTAQLQDADPKTKLDFYYMMDMYDKKDISGAGVGRAFKEMGLDPASYIGIGTLGMGLVGKQAATVAAKTGLKTMLKQGAIKFLQSPAAVAATEGAIYTGVDDVARQDAAIGAGLQDEYSPTQTAVASGIGAAAGAGIVKGTQVIGKGIGKGIDKVMTEGEEAMAQAAGGGTPPKVNATSEIPTTARTYEDIIKDINTDEGIQTLRSLDKGNGVVLGGDEFYKEPVYGAVYVKKGKQNPESVTPTEDMSVAEQDNLDRLDMPFTDKDIFVSSDGVEVQDGHHRLARALDENEDIIVWQEIVLDDLGDE